MPIFDKIAKNSILRICKPLKLPQHHHVNGYQRFRPNIVVDPVGGEPGFAEDAWIGHTLAIGDAVRLSITGPCGRCVMTTLAQGELPKDTEILRTAVQQHQGQVGVYAAVVQGGTIRHGDRVRLGD
jgi:uncharacterized protein